MGSYLKVKLALLYPHVISSHGEDIFMINKRGLKRKFTCGNLSFGSNNSDFGRRNWYSHFVKLHIEAQWFIRAFESEVGGD